MLKRLFAVSLLALVGLASGCVDFDRETVLYRYQAAKDELRLVLIYEGIHGQDELDLTEKEVGELQKAMTEKQAFFFSNWLFSYSSSMMNGNIAELEAQLAGKSNPVTTTEWRAENARLLPLMKAFQQAITVTNGEFFHNGRGELCAYQIITISQASVWLRTINQMISHQLNTTSQEELAKRFDDDSQKRLIAAGKDGYEFLRLDGNRLLGSFPLSAADYLKQRQQLAATLRQQVAGKDDEARLHSLRAIADLMAADLQLYYTGGQVQLELGQPQGRYTELSMILKDEYNTSALPTVQKAYGINDQLGIEEVRSLIMAEH
jgi:hypothetical protein